MGVGIDVQPDGFIICLGTDDVVMEGFLPDGVMEVFGYAALSLLDDVGNRRGNARPYGLGILPQSGRFFPK